MSSSLLLTQYSYSVASCSLTSLSSPFYSFSHSLSLPQSGQGQTITNTSYKIYQNHSTGGSSFNLCDTHFHFEEKKKWAILKPFRHISACHYSPTWKGGKNGNDNNNNNLQYVSHPAGRFARVLGETQQQVEDGPPVLQNTLWNQEGQKNQQMTTNAQQDQCLFHVM